MAGIDAGGQTLPAPNNSRVPLILGVETPLLLVSFVLWILRMDSRCRPVRKLWWDDLLFLSLCYVVCVLSINVGYGRHTIYLPPDNLVPLARLFLLAEPLWVWEVTFIKVSVACMFLRLSRTVLWQKTWNWVMYISVFYLLASAIIVLCIQLTECTPLNFFWDPSVKGGHCRSPGEVRTAVIGTSVVFAFSDLQFSLLPLAIIMTLNRPRTERVTVACLMGLGLLATIIGCLKFIDFDKLRSSPDPSWAMVPSKLGSFAEASIGIIAANLPPLKARGQQLMSAISSGFSTSHSSTSSNASTFLHRDKRVTTAVSKNSYTAEEDLVAVEEAQAPGVMKDDERGCSRIQNV